MNALSVQTKLWISGQ